MINKNLLFIFSFFFAFGLSTTKAQKKALNKKPNIIVILADDMGYSDLGCFGSETKTPNLDEMAAKGLKMTQFYNASRCCPTRASLLTGLYQHQAGVGDMMNTRKEPAYQGYLNQNCVTIAEALKSYGYTTLMAGKWHVGQAPANWPVKRGFDRYFGLIDGAGSYFGPYPYRPKQKLTIALDDKEFTPDKDYYSTNAYTDYALKFIEENDKTKKPFFLYLAYQAPHWPLHALQQDIVKYKGKYMQGWDKLREARFKRMQEMGIIPKNIKLSPRDSNLPEWNSLSQAEKLNWDDKMAVYAAMLDCMDQNIGRIRKKLKDLGQENNTVIMFLSDNGASNETINPNGFLPEIFQSSKKLASDPSSFTAYGFEGANVSNTPFRLFKHWEYEGGTATPFIAYGPTIIKAGVTSHQPGHIIDIMTTCLNLAGANYPSIYKDRQIKQSAGVNLVPLFKGQKWIGHNALFFEHEGNRAVRKGDWKLVSNYPDNEWHLFNMVADRTELNDLSKSQPKKVQELIALYNNWAQKSDVISFEKLATKKGEGY
ncbi:arylsulfatase [Pedobacter polaris]|uniref:Arylsulfatase n=1 Tax=Pedobacter polaris TaxID=2571273 RepID=A0A4U1CW39_9SPHI|nr:arylsulfatase [Pedobacter polaris]TKC10469.1 arylsulfatase [Pedobacter polaris]